jgi:alkylated DNA repair dioxygenase AlkB
MRFSKSNPPPENEPNRQLLRPVYWLGNWQFACLNYYHPPKGIQNRCVLAESFPDFMQAVVSKIESLVLSHFDQRDVPYKWHLNTCLINYYGDHLVNGKKTDCARVGEHKDFEPGPVASISFGERAMFQFVESRSKADQSKVVQQMWLEDCSLQIFGGDRYKKRLFHRVQRVERKLGQLFTTNTDGFETRRINLTFRFVPRDHIQELHRFPENLQQDVAPYIAQLARQSEFFKLAQHSINAEKFKI